MTPRDDLQSTPDLLTSYVEGVCASSKAALCGTGSLSPTITYLKGGMSYSFPFDYDALVHLGRHLHRGPRFGMSVIRQIGPEISGLAVNLAERATRAGWAARDRRECRESLVNMLGHISPDIFVLSAPSADPWPISELRMLKPMTFRPRAKNMRHGILVVGFSRIRTFSIFSSVEVIGEEIKFGKENVRNIIDGGISNPIFGSVFTPRKN